MGCRVLPLCFVFVFALFIFNASGARPQKPIGPKVVGLVGPQRLGGGPDEPLPGRSPPPSSTDDQKEELRIPPDEPDPRPRIPKPLPPLPPPVVKNNLKGLQKVIDKFSFPLDEPWPPGNPPRDPPVPNNNPKDLRSVVKPLLPLSSIDGQKNELRIPPDEPDPLPRKPKPLPPLPPLVVKDNLKGLQKIVGKFSFPLDEPWPLRNPSQDSPAPNNNP